jgi:hypothetical protein
MNDGSFAARIRAIASVFVAFLSPFCSLAFRKASANSSRACCLLRSVDKFFARGSHRY